MTPELQREASAPETPPERLSALCALGRALRRAVAANPGAPPALLSSLATDKDRETRQAVAGNPNTPSDVLLALAVPFPEAFFQNPALPLLLLERPAILEEIEEDTLRLMLRAPVPPEVAPLLTGHRSGLVRARVAQHAGLAPGELEALARDPYWLVRSGVAGNPGASPALLEQLAGDLERGVRASVAAHPAAPGALLARLAQDADPYTLQRVAEARATPPEVLEHLARSHRPEVRLGVARNPSASRETLELLRRDLKRSVKIAAGKGLRRLEWSVPVARRRAKPAG